MANPFITQLKREHALLATLLDDVRKAGIATELGQRSLGKAKAALLAHLKKEDDELYPVLRDAAKRDARLSALLLQYARDMEQVSTVAMAFFTTYAKGGTGYDFGRDYGALMARLKSRINGEENELYAEYERIKAARSAPPGQAGAL